MSYTALYRKWRSQTFDEIKGQDPIIESFKNQIKTGRIGHAYLFCGTRGTGKTSVAKILARAVNCENPDNGNPCNKCASCRSVLNDSSMNVIEMDAASNNSVEDIRQIRDQVQYPPVDARFKVYIIDEVHMLSQAAFNAFLKTLEEPPEYVIFVLATTEPNKLPITILSRCQRYDFRRISTETITERLHEIASSEGIAVDDEALHYIARVGDGSMRDSVSLLDQCSAFQFDHKIEYEDALNILGAVDTSVFSDMICALNKKDIRDILNIISEVIEQGREIGQFINDLIMYIRNLLLAKSVDNLNGLVDMSNENLLKLKDDSKLFSVDELLRFVRMLSELSNQMRYSVSKRILLETTLMKMAYPETDTSLEGLNAKLSEIKRNIANINIDSIKNGNLTETLGKAKDFVPKEIKSDSPKKVALPKAQYEDLQLLKKEWRNICIAVPSSVVSVALKDSYVKPNREHDGMIIVTKSKACYKIISENESKDMLCKVVEDRYNKSIKFSTELSEEKENSTIYVTDDDLSKININIETEG
ncbi:DNA polymerase-3 subunit gamma/tau [Oribacterium sp. KHPX15]|uniref:DNA polymerase III subunit gamma/tau n=1 Tax=Oribacterium sp. KHPX15 TaxID=1855342 RepID=UPI000895D540|nr:DNA polymerase III subunit gamma/tau [Oribacterium sp. KHPX15]SEA93162.1 DNA polymerase-3 subunit gamma/tau [Oribacterium sp. KHPX15]